MKAPAKSAFIIVATLLVGVVIGALATSAIMHSRLEQLQALRMRGGIERFLERVISPVDDDQRAQIADIIEDFAGQQTALRQHVFEQQGAIFDSMRVALDEILTNEQRENLRAWFGRERFRRRGSGPPFERRELGPPDFRRRRGPGSDTLNDGASFRRPPQDSGFAPRRPPKD